MLTYCDNCDNQTDPCEMIHVIYMDGHTGIVCFDCYLDLLEDGEVWEVEF